MAPVTPDQDPAPRATEAPDAGLLGPAQIRELADRLGVSPTKQWGQNFVIDKGTVRRIVRASGVGPGEAVVEVGPGLGSLTLALLPVVEHLTVVEIDPRLAQALPETVQALAPDHADRLDVVHSDALQVTELPGPAPTALVANLPYNVAVPVVLTLLERFPSLRTVLVMVQLEVAERMAAAPGSKVYGVPSVKCAWYGPTRLAGRIGRNVFWPAPNVDSGLVRIDVQPRDEAALGVRREDVFACIDAAFAQRRKTLRAALAGWAGSPQAAEEALVAAGIDPRTRGEALDIEAFAAIAAARKG
ncbi:16S rRNA (adenine(1518)-N(6)/adenine(1519)-N(6))-dimethyltransferase RsmA [Kytococcus sedentarius]|uniref:16S rRNA (adenine(1518)-N(6)/adenine(1519)-N(6))- dimethyltransferase RsmA n=1 Tax=Kytococcus sedentarius TaxID=1276 RepID=UPI0035BC5566